jgi:hypothetical protein
LDLISGAALPTTVNEVSRLAFAGRQSEPDAVAFRKLSNLLILLQALDSDWVIVTNNKAFLNSNFNKNHVSKWPNERFTAYWTDDFSSVISVINWKREFDWLKIALGEMGWTN